MLKKYIRKIIISILSLFVAYILNSLAFPKIFNKTILSMLGDVAFIYYVFILCLIILAFLIYLYLRIKYLSEKNGRKIYKGFSKVKKKELKNLKDEHKAILNYLAGEESLSTYKEDLIGTYIRQFPGNEERGLNLHLKELQRLGLLTLSSGVSDIFIVITDRGCELLSKLNSS